MSRPTSAAAVPLIALHESGHCVMALHLGTRGVVRLRLTPDDPARGGVCSFGLEDAGDARHSILITLGGHAAEAVQLGHEPTRRSARDDRQAFETALHFTGSVPTANRLVAALRVQAREILERADRWPVVLAIAEALHRRGELSGREAYAIALGALRPTRRE